DPRLATELGRLNWNGELTVAMTAAGHRISEIYGRYEGYKRKGRHTRSPLGQPAQFHQRHSATHFASHKAWPHDVKMYAHATHFPPASATP
ncbi:MAG: hypothetical protein V4555_14020, partial [Acidobacteriota bacterium]